VTSDRAEASGSKARRLGRDEGLALVREWRASGQRAAEFCRARGVPLHRLQYWKHRCERDAAGEGSSETAAFFALTVGAESEPHARGTGAAEAAVHDGIELWVGSVRMAVCGRIERERFVQTLRLVLEAVEA
jgi:hypothetical protein